MIRVEDTEGGASVSFTGTYSNLIQELDMVLNSLSTELGISKKKVLKDLFAYRENTGSYITRPNITGSEPANKPLKKK